MVSTKHFLTLYCKPSPHHHLTNFLFSQGLPVGAVKNALQRDGLDPGIMDLDPNKALASQQNQEELVDKGPPLKDDPKYQKYFRVSYSSQHLCSMHAYSKLMPINCPYQLQMLKMVRSKSLPSMGRILCSDTDLSLTYTGPSNGSSSKCDAARWYGSKYNGPRPK